MRDREACVVVCDAERLRPDIETVEALLQLAIGARRLGWDLCLANASRELRELVAFMGLDEVFGRQEGA